MKTKTYHLFEATGIELEYMIVDSRNGSVRPIAASLFPEVSADDELDTRRLGEITLSNELAAHVIELKTDPPAISLIDRDLPFAQAIRQINAELEPHGARLCPGGTHPWMDPAVEGQIWPGGCTDIYHTYDRIFGCRGHGWLNLQSFHINLPFSGDTEFADLHTAILLLLPALPALSASSPYLDGNRTNFLDTRLKVYEKNQERCPLVAAKVIPDPVFSEQEYRTRILAPMYREIAPLDVDELLREEWLNSRGAIARFERSAIEIRILDVQECPAMDFALAELITASLKAIIESHGTADLKKLAALESTGDRYRQYTGALQDGMSTPLVSTSLRALAGGRNCQSLRQWWLQWIDRLPSGTWSGTARNRVELILNEGCLAERMLARAGPDPHRTALHKLLEEMSHCLAENQPFSP